MIDLSPAHLAIVERILAEHVPGCEVRAFGSRATWNAKDYSDLDLAVVGEGPLPRGAVGRLKEAFEESRLPMRVDVVDWHSIADGFRELIAADCVVVQETPGRTGSPTVALGEAVELTLSSVDKKSKSDEHPVLLCNYTDVYNNDFIYADMDFMPATATDREIARCSLHEGDVIITKDSEAHDDIGVPALVRETAPNLLCGYHLAILRPKPQVDGKYLFYALKTREAQQQFHAYANGVTRFGLRKADIGLVEFPLPPLEEQRAIARVLGALDDKIELNRRMSETLEGMARALFRSWFVDFDPVCAKAEGRPSGLPPDLDALFPASFEESELGEIPAGWEVTTLGEVIEVNPPRQIRRGDVATHVEMAALPTSGPHVAYWTERAFTSGSRFARGDTLLARITPSLENGKTAFVDFLDDGETGWGSTEFIVLRPKSPWPREIAYMMAREPDFREHAIVNMTGTSGRQRVPVEAVATYPIAVPPEGVAEAYGRLARPSFERSTHLRDESRDLAEQRDALLPQLVSGELRARAVTLTETI